MAIIAQKKLFGWKDIEELGDLQREADEGTGRAAGQGHG